MNLQKIISDKLSYLGCELINLDCDWINYILHVKGNYTIRIYVDKVIVCDTRKITEFIFIMEDPMLFVKIKEMLNQ